MRRYMQYMPVAYSMRAIVITCEPRFPHFTLPLYSASFHYRQGHGTVQRMVPYIIRMLHHSCTSPKLHIPTVAHVPTISPQVFINILLPSSQFTTSRFSATPTLRVPLLPSPSFPSHHQSRHRLHLFQMHLPFFAVTSIHHYSPEFHQHLACCHLCPLLPGIQ